MKIQPISTETIKLLNGNDIVQQMQNKDKADFSSFLTDSITSVNQSLIESNKAIEKLALGEIESTHEVIIAMEKAKMSLQLAAQVRNKLVESYKEILRMQI